MAGSDDGLPSGYRDMIRSHYAPNAEHRDIAREAYEKAITFIEDELHSKTSARTFVFAESASVEDIYKIVEQAKTRYDTSTLNRKDVLKSLHKFSSRMIYFSQVLDVVAQHHPEYVALVWGAMKFIFIGIINHGRLVYEFSQALATIGDALRTAKLGAELFQTDAMRDALAQLYAHVLLFFQGALRWYNRSPAGRAFSAVFKPYELTYQDTAEQIRVCAQAVSDIASAASRTEVRDMNITIQLMRQDSDRREEKLREVQTQLRQTQEIQLKMERSVNDMLQVVTSHRALTDRININVEDMTPRIRDIQFSQILQTLKPTVCQQVAFDKARSVYQRANATRLPESKQSHIARGLEQWLSSSQSSIFTLRVGARAERRAKELTTDVISLLRSKSHNVIWRITPVDWTSGANSTSLSELCQTLIYQILQLEPSVVCSGEDLSVAKFRVVHSEAEWIFLLQKLFRRVSKCFVVLETHDLFRAHQDDDLWTSHFLSTMYRFAETVTQSGGVTKFLILCYGNKPLVDPQAPTGIQRLSATLMRPAIIPASRRRTIAHQRQRNGWHRYTLKI